MKREFFYQAARNVLQSHGRKWALKAGDRASTSISKFARKKGYIDREYKLDELVAELQKMHSQGRFKPEEWKKIKQRIKESLNKKQ